MTNESVHGARNTEKNGAAALRMPEVFVCFVPYT